MSPWGVLLRMVPEVTAKLKGLGCRRLRWLVDGEVVYWALLVPEESDLEAHGRFPGMPQWTLEGWLRGTLERFEAGWPGARTVELLGVWPDRLERVARVFPKTPEGSSSSEECYADPPSS
ncbi:hypothetical protein [Meiothermus ruber]|uniref:hypothetical protein n=1 Tax=Meiothermus ruber TaxID=277 RepID=UPI0003D5E97F|nr:hypothetical protein [Meiothermus ruber]GAO74204.1 putative uncharacterized protein [Meiothermus ruber H328]